MGMVKNKTKIAEDAEDFWGRGGEKSIFSLRSPRLCKDPIMPLIFNCREDNDLYQVLSSMGHAFPRYTTLSEALGKAPQDAAVLTLADDYPRPGVEVEDGHLQAASARNLRLYVEYPASLPGISLGEPRPTEWERVVVSSDFFAPDMEAHTILALHGCWFMPVETEEPHLVVARVAGYYTAVYGLSEGAFPILFELPGQNVLVATSKLSQFVTAR